MQPKMYTRDIGLINCQLSELCQNHPSTESAEGFNRRDFLNPRPACRFAGYLFLALFSIVLIAPCEKVLSQEPTLLMTYDWNLQSGTRSVASPLTLTLSIADPADIEPNEFPLFENIALTESDAGQVFRADAISDPDFLGFVARATDGQEDAISFFASYLGGGAGIASPESHARFDLDVPRLGSDLIGYQINYIELDLQSLSISTRSTPWTSYNADIQVRWYGSEVPEPSSLITLGFIGLISMRRRRCSDV